MTSMEGLKKAIQANPQFKHVWERTATGSGGTESEDDLSLANHLARVLEGTLRRLTLHLYNHHIMQVRMTHTLKKWERDDYRQDIIRKAITSYHSIKMSIEENLNFNDSGNAVAFVENYKDSVFYNVENKNMDDMEWRVLATR